MPVATQKRQPNADRPAYDQRYGETDLLESAPRRRSEIYLFGGAMVLLALICAGGVGFFALRLLPGSEPTATPTSMATQPVINLATNTIAPTPVLATVTLPPPTDTATPTPGPCTHRVQAGEDLISIAWGCGHRSLDVLQLILDMNDLDSAESLQVGQELMIPWPTATPDPNNPNAGDDDEAADTPNDAESTDAAFFTVPGLELASAPTRAAPTPIPSPTMLPGVMWHTVVPNENIVAIAYAYHTNLETLSQLNPEVTFSQCEFGSASGGPSCTVMIYEGQQIRVPAPTPIPTLSPTLSGSETPTPTWTPTFNAPSVIGPANRSLFTRSELVTLRWVASGVLSEGDVYRVQVDDLTAGKTYTGDTTELFFILPAAWQGTGSGRHDYRWTVSVVKASEPGSLYFTTDPRLFTWEGR